MKYWRWNLPVDCRLAGEHIEKVTSAGTLRSPGEWIAAAPSEVRGHVAGCEACRTRIEELFAARLLLQNGRSAAADPGPAFTAAVMRAIAERESLGDKTPSPWFAVPRMAARVALVSAVALLLASTWAYERRTPIEVTSASADALLEPTPQPATQDEVLLSLAGREP